MIKSILKFVMLAFGLHKQEDNSISVQSGLHWCWDAYVTNSSLHPIEQEEYCR